MTKEDLIQFLKDQLTIKCEHFQQYNENTIVVSLFLGEKEISYDNFKFYTS